MRTMPITSTCSVCCCSARPRLPRFQQLQMSAGLPLQRHRIVRMYAANGDPEQARQDRDTLVVAVSTALFTGLGMFSANLAPDQLRGAAELFLQPDVVAGFGIGDIVGAIMWSVGLYYCSPLQYLLLFFGRFDTERPSDWLIQKLRLLAGQRMDDINYSVPWWMQLVAIALYAVCGFSVVYVLNSSLGDSTWSVATGMGSLVGAGMYEVGRPRRLSVQEAQTLELQWQDFAVFANKRLQRSGQCHESEVWLAFRRDYSKYRVTGVLSNEDLRSMVRNWHPDVRRSAAGYYKNLSLRPYVDPFTGERSGADVVTRPPATVAREQPQ